jgi:ATP-dependent Lhr-like helicase
VLISAPTGSGKTLAAFLWGLDRLTAQPAAESERRTRLLYVSPLKALSYDIERNLRAPLRGIQAGLGEESPRVTVALRTGDTPQRERQQMLRHPPDILITTPESLYLMLTSRAREILHTVEWLIIDEIHAVAATKRGAHLALTLERLDALTGGEVQRIGLSATQRPLEEVARFMVGPQRKCRIVDTGIRKPLDLQIHVPVESMTEPQPATALDPLAGGEPTLRSIWPAMYPELLRLIREHRSTIVFVNNRRSAERLALRLNELAETEVARAHHGSLAREERLIVEEQLKAGTIPCIVATSSLELGIDMGAVDLVIQVESPKSVAAGLQRIGRAGHNVGDISKGRIFPKYRADLLECAVVAKRMREGAIEPTVVPRNPLDVLAQQIVAMAAAEEELAVDDLHTRVTRTYSYAELSRAQLENVLDMLDGRYPSSEFAELRPRIVWDRLGGVIRPRKAARALAVANAGTIPDRGLYMVVLPDGRRVGELDEEMVYEARPGQVFLLGASSWRIEEIGRDRVIVTPAPGVPGAIPFWKGDGIGRPKELGEAIGAFSRWAVDQEPQVLERDYDLDRRAAVNLIELLREQQAATGVLPSDRTIVIERFRDEIGDWRLCVLSPYGGRIHAAWGLALSARIRDELGLEADAISSDDGIVVHLPDMDGAGDDWSAAALGGSAAGGETSAARELPSALDLALIDPEELEDLVVAELSSSALFGARFRENAARALLIPRAYPGKRTPLWQQRLKAQTLLEVAKRYGDFPIVLETYRECLRDVLDLPGLRELLGKLQRRELSVVEVETPTASPLASSLLFNYVATYMYEGDTPNAERRAAALSLDRDLLRELLGQEELRDLIDPGAMADVEDDLQHRSPRTRAATRDELHDVLRRIGDLTEHEAAERVHEGIDAATLLGELERERRAIRVRIAGSARVGASGRGVGAQALDDAAGAAKAERGTGGEQRWIDAADAGLYRDALGVVAPGGLPEAFLGEVPNALAVLMRRYAQTHAPFPTAQPKARYGLDPSLALAELERGGEIVRGELLPGGTSGEREWCDTNVLRRLRRASLAVLRKEIEPADQRAFAAFLPAWQGVDRHPKAPVNDAAAIERLREQLVPLQGLALTPQTWERDVLPRRLGGYSPAWLDALCASGELVWLGAGALGRASGRVALYFREDLPLLGPPPQTKPQAPDAPSAPEQEALRARLAAGACFFTDLLADLQLEPEVLQEALWDLAFSGAVTNDAFAPLRAPRLALARSGPVGPRPLGRPMGTPASLAGTGLPGVSHGRSTGRRFSTRRGARPHSRANPPGRWSLTAPLFAERIDPSARRRAQAELLLERYGILTRELVLAEGIPGGFSALYPELCQLETLGVARRGYFVEGLGGAQFALPGAVERLRACRVPSVYALQGAQPAPEEAPPLLLAATDPAQVYGAALPWPRRPAGAATRELHAARGPHGGAKRSPSKPSPPSRRPARAAGAHVVLVGSEPVLYLERGARALQVLVAPEDPRLPGALLALAGHARSGRLSRVALERVDGEAVLGSRWEQLLIEVGFHAGPRRLTLSA